LNEAPGITGLSWRSSKSRSAARSGRKPAFAEEERHDDIFRFIRSFAGETDLSQRYSQLNFEFFISLLSAVSFNPDRIKRYLWLQLRKKIGNSGSTSPSQSRPIVRIRRYRIPEGELAGILFSLRLAMWPEVEVTRVENVMLRDDWSLA